MKEIMKKCLYNAYPSEEKQIKALYKKERMKGEGLYRWKVRKLLS